MCLQCEKTQTITDLEGEIQQANWKKKFAEWDAFLDVLTFCKNKPSKEIK